MEKYFTKLNNATERLEVEKRQRELELAKQEELSGLNKFYEEIATPEMLENNFTKWKNHLAELLNKKYPNHNEQEAALKKAELFSLGLPLRHGAIYNDLKNSVVPHISSNFMMNRQHKDRDVGGHTTSFDNQKELNHFVYCFLGFQTFEKTAWDTQVYIKNNVLREPDTIVSLEDYGWGTSSRMVDQDYQGMGSVNSEKAFEVQLQQIWRGEDFSKLLPMFLAYAYSNPEEYNERKPFPKNTVPKELPQLVDYLGHPDFPNFEIRIPQSIRPKDIIGFFVDCSQTEMQPTGDSAIAIPTDLSSTEKLKFVQNKIQELQK